jgi:DNA invertase Pin-like site-specific DNA recombinase
MLRYRTAGHVEADLIALRASAERAGLALACLFSSADEYEADLIRERRARGAYRAPRRQRRPLRTAAIVTGFALAFLLV